MEGQAKDAAKALKNRFKGKAEKFLEKRRQQSPAVEDSPQQDVDSFLSGQSDKLYMMPPENTGTNVPALSRIDTSNAPRWPSVNDINSTQRARSTSPHARRGRKGLHVHFIEAQPEIIGVGGDECEIPTLDIGKRKRAYSHPQAGAQGQMPNTQQMQPGPPPYPIDTIQSHPMVPPLLPHRRPVSSPRPREISSEIAQPVETPQAHSTMQQPSPPRHHAGPPILPEIRTGGTDLLSGGGDQGLLMSKLQEMRSGEGKTFVKATSQSHPIDQHFPRTGSPISVVPSSTNLQELHDNTIHNAQITAPLPEAPILKEPIPPLPAKEYATSLDIVSPIESSHRSVSPPDRNIAISPPISEHTRAATPPPAVATSQVPSFHVQEETPAPEPASMNAPPVLQIRKPSPASAPVPIRASPLPTPQPTPEPEAHLLTMRPTSMISANSYTTQDTLSDAANEALQDFSRRSAHLYTLFRLSAESVKPLPKCSPQELVRIALWWFLKGRSTLETTFRDRPTTPQGQQANLQTRQQAHADLAKALWIIEHVTSQFAQRQMVSTGPNTPMADILSAQSTMLASLKKLAISMTRNNMLPPDPDDAPLPQGVDNTIWKADDGDRSLVMGQRLNSTLSLLESFSLGDTENHFQYGRMFVEAMVLEEAASRYYRAHVLLSILRSQREKGLTVTVASQDGLVNIAIQDDATRGPTWNDVVWHHNTYTIIVTLPRGFKLQLHCQQMDYEALWNLFDLHNEIYAVLDAREGEELIFDTTIKIFQQFKLGENGESLPQQPLPNCYLRVFQRVLISNSPSGSRKSHRGFRVGLATNVKTKNVKGVDRVLLPNFPIQFGYLRGDGGMPALLLKSSDENSQNNIVFTFDDVNQRTRLHTLLTGLALANGEEVVSETAIKGFGVTNEKNYEAKCLKYFDWKSLRLITEAKRNSTGGAASKSHNLRLVLDFKAGTITDRMDLGPGEFRLRLEVNNSTQLKILRQPQQDLTVAVSELTKDIPTELADMLRIMGRYETTRTFTFGDVQQLHLFQAAITGYKPLFDGIAASFSISRRRAVVPLYKKWEALNSRIQLVERNGQVQLVAFFEGFNHGSCMSFVLKPTDVFETSGKSNKSTIKIVDAKFALPKVRNEGHEGSGHEFVCLDMVELPTEHDDVSIVFDAEAGMSFYPYVR